MFILKKNNNIKSFFFLELIFGWKYGGILVVEYKFGDISTTTIIINNIFFNEEKLGGLNLIISP